MRFSLNSNWSCGPLDAERAIFRRISMTLAQLAPGQRGRIRALFGVPALVQRLYELGLIEDADVEVLAVAPFGDPIEVRSGAIRLSLRKAEAANVELADPI